VLIPAFSFSGSISKSVQHRSNLVVAVANGHPANDLQGLHWGCSIGPRTRPFHFELRVHTSLPVKGELQSFLFVIGAHHNLLHSRAKEHLLQRRRAAFTIPDFGKVLTHQMDSGFVFRRQRVSLPLEARESLSHSL